LEAGIEQVKGAAGIGTPSAADLREGVAKLYQAASVSPSSAGPRSKAETPRERLTAQSSSAADR
jgi:hypothetical protein